MRPGAKFSQYGQMTRHKRITRRGISFPGAPFNIALS
jgi:hypothetical protein